MMRSNDFECPICLGGMSESDVTYPLLCPTGCGYNFCATCVEHLVKSSKDDYQMASDGNRHVKVHLQCPQCRGDLANTINDTLLLRKAKRAERYREVPDSELNASELRIKHELTHNFGKEVEHAEARLRKFLIEHGNTDEIPAHLEVLDDIQNDDDRQAASVSEPSFIDTTLLQGLENSMSDDEKLYVQKLMTSGEASNLADAAQILNGILQITLQGMAPRHYKELTRQEERKQIEFLELFRKRYPLPARMPKYFVLGAFPQKKKIVVFEDDQWDGSISDAFSRVHTTIPKNKAGIDNILKDAEDRHWEPRPRIKVAAVKGPAGRLGLQKGDVVTHFDGEPFIGSAVDLAHIIDELYKESPDATFQFVVNADESTAQVLKLRAEKCRKAMADVASLS